MMEDPYIPLGFRFCPTDEEVIHYLLLKNYGLVLPSNQIKECDVYACNPDQLPQDFNYALGNELYFFTTRERRYFNGSRPSRAAGDGFWKATCVEQVIKGIDESSIIGYKKKLVFHYNENKTKTDWQMHEYRIEKTDGSAGKESMKMDGFVICRIYERKTKASKSDALAVELFNSFDFDTHAPTSSSQSAGDAI